MNTKKYLIVALTFISFILVTCVENHMLPNFGILSIKSDPVGAEVFIDGEKKGITNLELNEVLSGNYTITLKKSEFKDSVFTVEVDENQELSFDVFMKETNPKGVITVTSEPSGATIFINSASTGKKTPSTFSNLERGIYNFSLRLNLFENANFEIDLNKDQTIAKNTKLTVASSAGILFINSSPTGAQIYIDDNNTGKVTPDTIKPLVPGEHAVKLLLTNYNDTTFTTNISAGIVTNENISLKALFDIAANVNPPNSGTITGTGTYVEGESAELTAIPNVGYNFVNWTENDNEVSSDTTYIFVVDGPRNLVANFELKQYQISASVNPSNAGVVSGSGTYNHGDQVSLTVSKNSGFGFINWTENDSEVSTSENYTFTATRNRTLVVNLSLNSYTISGNTSVGNANIAWTGGPGTTSNSSGNYSFSVTHGWSGTVTPTKTGYAFAPVNRTYSNVTSNQTNQDFTAIVQITTNVSPADAGTITGLNILGNYNYNETVNITANPAVGYKFFNWTEGGSEISTSANLIFPATVARDLTANFISIGNLFVESDPVGADIYLDNINTGQVTPFTFQDLETGEYTITLKLEDFADTNLITDIFTGQTTNTGEIYMRDITPDVDVQISYEVRPNQQLLFTFVFNQDIRFDMVEITTPTEATFPQNYGGVLLIEGVGITWTYPEKIAGNWQFKFSGRKVDGRQSSFILNKTHLVE